MSNNKIIQFRTVSDISVGAGSVSSLGPIARDLGIKRMMFITDPGIIKLKLLDSAVKSLTDSNIAVTLYADVIADPPEAVIEQAVKIAQAADCDGVVGFGGGSSMDTAKLVAVLINGEQSLAEMYGVDMVTNTKAPLIQIPTTAGTGSEVTMVAIVTTGGTTKAGVVSRRLLADRVILDPELTVGLPAHISAATGIDSMVHAIEAFTSVHLKNPLSDMLAKQALTLLAANIRLVCEKPADLAAREAMLLGAMIAGQAFANSPVAAVHALAYPLGGNYHIPHGLSNSLVLPHVLRFNSGEAGALYRELTPLILGDGKSGNYESPGSDADATEKLADYFITLAKDTGLPTRLKAMDISVNDLPMLAREAMLQQRLLVNNPRLITEEGALTIYQNAY